MVDTGAAVRVTAGSIRLLPGSSARDGSTRLFRGEKRRRNACQISQSTHAARKSASKAAGKVSNMDIVIPRVLMKLWGNATATLIVPPIRGW